MATSVCAGTSIDLDVAYDVWQGTKVIGYSEVPSSVFALHLIKIHRQYCEECFPSDCQQQDGDCRHRRQVKMETSTEYDTPTQSGDMPRSTDITMKCVKLETIDYQYQQDSVELIADQELEANFYSANNNQLLVPEDHSETVPDGTNECLTNNQGSSVNSGDTTFTQNINEGDNVMNTIAVKTEEEEDNQPTNKQSQCVVHEDRSRGEERPVIGENPRSEPYPTQIIQVTLHADTVERIDITQSNINEKETPLSQKKLCEVGNDSISSRKEKSFGSASIGKDPETSRGSAKHTTILTNTTQFVCEEHKQFNQKSHLKRQTTVDTTDRPFVCKECGKRFYRSVHLKRHIRIHTNDRLYVCKECGKGFNRSVNLKAHRRTHTNLRPFVCEECSKGFYLKSSFNAHMQIHINKKNVFKVFYKNNGLMKQMRVKTNKHACKKCGRGFSERSTLKRHIKIHSKKRPHVCKECGKGFTEKCNLKAHLHIHTGEKAFICKECGRGFYDSRCLKNHIRMHTNEKPFRCKECGKGFPASSNLKRHLRIHSNERPYVCIECGIGFNEKCNLKAHMRIHTNERSFVCKECGKGFNQSSTMKVHMRIHTNERSFVCKECGKGFKRSGTMKTHMKTHTQEQNSQK